MHLAFGDETINYLVKFSQIKVRTLFVKGTQTPVCALICDNLCNLWLYFLNHAIEDGVLNLLKFKLQ